MPGFCWNKEMTIRGPNSQFAHHRSVTSCTSWTGIVLHSTQVAKRGLWYEDSGSQASSNPDKWRPKSGYTCCGCLDMMTVDMRCYIPVWTRWQTSTVYTLVTVLVYTMSQVQIWWNIVNSSNKPSEKQITWFSHHVQGWHILCWHSTVDPLMPEIHTLIPPFIYVNSYHY